MRAKRLKRLGEVDALLGTWGVCFWRGRGRLFFFFFVVLLGMFAFLRPEGRGVTGPILAPGFKVCVLSVKVCFVFLFL